MPSISYWLLKIVYSTVRAAVLTANIITKSVIFANDYVNYKLIKRGDSKFVY
jgi:hypothetical protein